jgi:hypothetical protein
MLRSWYYGVCSDQAACSLRMLATVKSKSKSHCDWQSVSLGVKPHLEPMTRYLLLRDSYGLVPVGRPLWREEGSVFFMCCWPLPAQSFSGPSPLGLETIFYCLRFETSLFVTSYDSQGHGGGIRPRSTREATAYQLSNLFSLNALRNLVNIRVVDAKTWKWLWFVRYTWTISRHAIRVTYWVSRFMNFTSRTHRI